MLLSFKCKKVVANYFIATTFNRDYCKLENYHSNKQQLCGAKTIVLVTFVDLPNVFVATISIVLEPSVSLISVFHFPS